MIITKNVKIEINRGNIPYYKKFEVYKNIKIGDIVDIDLKYLSKSNKNIITYTCDICGKENNIIYSSYNDIRRNKEQDVCKGVCSNTKREITNMELYGVKNCFQNEEMKKKSKESMIEKYGVVHNMKTQKCLDDRVKTYQKNYGCDNPSQSDIIKRKKEETCFKNFGVKYPLQNCGVFVRNKLSGNKIHKFIKNENITYQGTYELDFLNTYYDMLNIDEPNFTVSYNLENKQHKYHPDFFIKNYNLIIEIKSDYTYFKEEDENIAKRKYCIINGYKFIFIINKNYLNFNGLLKLLML